MHERGAEALREHDRHDRDEDDQRRVRDRGTDRGGGGEDQRPRGLLAPLGPPRTYHAPDLLAGGDRLVDHDPHGHQEAGHDQGVHRVAERVEGPDGREQRERDGERADQERAPLEEEGDEREERQRESDHREQGQVVDRAVDVGRGLEDVGVHANAPESRRELVERALDPVGDLDRAGAGPLVDGQQEPRAAVHHRIADQRLVPVDDLGHVA